MTQFLSQLTRGKSLSVAYDRDHVTVTVCSSQISHFFAFLLT